MGLRSALYSAEDFPDTVQRNTDTSGTDLGQNNVVTFEPSGASSAVVAAQVGKIVYDADGADQAGAGHILGQVGYVDIEDAQDALFVIGHEGKVDNGTGTLTLGQGSNGQLSKNDGIVTTFHGHYAGITGLDASGLVTTFMGHVCAVDAAAATPGGEITNIYGHALPALPAGLTNTQIIGYFFGNQSNYSGSLKYSFLSQDADALFDSAGRIFGPADQEIAPPRHPGIITGRYYGPWGAGSLGASPIAADAIYAMPFFCPARTTWATLGINLTVGAVGGCRLGVYAMSGGLPGALIADAGTFDANVVSLHELTMTEELEAGFYFLAIISDTTPTVSYVATATGHDVMGTADGATVQYFPYRVFTYAALPDPFGAVSGYIGAAGPNVVLKA